jgi:hypothetical protein
MNQAPVMPGLPLQVNVAAARRKKINQKKPPIRVSMQKGKHRHVSKNTVTPSKLHYGFSRRDDGSRKMINTDLSKKAIESSIVSAQLRRQARVKKGWFLQAIDRIKGKA